MICQQVPWTEHGMNLNIYFTNHIKEHAHVQALAKGKFAHAEILKNGHVMSTYLGNLLIDMYGKCGSTKDSFQVFCSLTHQNVFSWTVLITAYVVCGCLENAQRTFYQMPCRNVVTWNAIIGAHARWGSLQNAQLLFDKMPERDVASWNTMIFAYALKGQIRNAFDIYKQMRMNGVAPNKVTFITILNACSNTDSLLIGRQIHGDIVDAGFGADVAVGTALLHMYGNCGKSDEAKNVFDNIHKPNTVSWNTMVAAYVQCGNVHFAERMFHKMPEPNLVTWNTMLMGYSRHGYVRKAFECYKQMQLKGFVADKVSFISILDACANGGALFHGKRIHSQILCCQLDVDVVVGSSLVNMYGKCGSLENAEKAFNNMPDHNVVSCNAMLSACIQCGTLEDVQNVFNKMLRPSIVSWNTIMSCYVQWGDLGKAQKVFEEMPERDSVSWNIMISGYAQHRSIEDTERLFRESPGQDVVAWNSIIAAYVKHGCNMEAFQVFQKMQFKGVNPSQVTIVSILGICSNQGWLDKGQWVHSHVIYNKLEWDIAISTALIDMYGSCGNISHAERVFDQIMEHNIISWNSMIAAYARYGSGKLAVQSFRGMLFDGFMPDNTSFVSMLSACSNAYLIDESLNIFSSMVMEYGIMHTSMHYSSMANNFGRVGELDYSEDLIQNMPFAPTSGTWTTLLDACRNV